MSFFLVIAEIIKVKISVNQPKAEEDNTCQDFD